MLGGLLGGLLPFDTTGMDFALTALFVVIFAGQWQERRNRLPALIGVGGSALCRMLFGADSFVLPAMICILLLVTLLQKPLAAVTLLIRALPFLLFPEHRAIPRYLRYLGTVLPAAVIGRWWCSVSRISSRRRPPYGLPELLSVAAVAALHLWKKNTLLSIGAGTALYMVLMQAVF